MVCCKHPWYVPSPSHRALSLFCSKPCSGFSSGEAQRRARSKRSSYGTGRSSRNPAFLARRERQPEHRLEK